MDNSDRSLALETAWERYAQLKTKASTALKQYLNLRGWGIVFLAIAALLAVVTAHPNSELIAPPFDKVVTLSLVLAPIISLVILAWTSKFQQGQYWSVLNTGAEEIRREIYLYRTLLQWQETRHQWLNERVTEIQRRVFELVGGNLVLKPYTGKIPPDFTPEDPNSDPGLTDLLADDYLRYRIEGQLQGYEREIARLHANRILSTIGIYILSGLSAFLPVLGSSFNVWVAFTSAVAIALNLWLELRRLDERVYNYNQLVLSLNIIRDHWQSLSPVQRTGDEFFKLVIATEKVLWSQHNQQIAEMHQAVAQLQGQPRDLLAEVLDKPVPKVIDQALLKQQVEVETLSVKVEVSPKETTVVEVVQQVKDEPQKPIKKGLPHAFVVMPFGRKQGPDGRWIDFNSIYQDLIKPALEEAGFESFRADEEAVSGDILTDMFQELLLADLVLADLSIDNANVFYELGVRHALRKRGLIHIQCGRAYMPYDIFNVRTLPYHCDDNGRPDPEYLDKDQKAIVKMAHATWESDHNRIHSPIFNLLTGLCEPDRKALRTPLATGYWEEYRQWQDRVMIAQRQKRIGDVLLLTEEVANPLIKEEAIADAGSALNNLGNYALALKEYRQGLKINPDNLEFRREEAFHLSQLKQFDEAIVKLERLLEEQANDIEILYYLAHIYRAVWIEEWIGIKDTQERVKAAYDAVHLLLKAIETYLQCYRLDQNHYYSGINALVLLAGLDHIAQQVGASNDPEEEALRQQLPALKGAVEFSLESAAKKDANNFWLFVSLGALAVCTVDDPKQVTRAYKKALTLAGKNKFALKSALEQLELLEVLSFRPEYVKAGISVIKGELHKFESQEEAVASRIQNEPRQVVLFSGHMIDRPDRPKPRFPAAMESEARQKIEEVLDRLSPCNNCLAIAPGAACGGDILFIEACLQRNIKVEVFLPFYQAEFIQESVSFAGDDWVARFYQIQNHPNVTIHLQPERLGEVPQGENPFERNNRWALYSTLMYGIDRVRLVVLWDGKGGDAPGGTGDMVQQVRQLGGIVEHLDTTTFDYWQTKKEILESMYQKLID